MGNKQSTAGPLSLRIVARAWLPLAASWLIMALEMPLAALVLARMKDPTLNLAAYGGVVVPIGLALESPVFMLLSASTALSRDMQSYRVLKQFTHRLVISLMLIHLLVVVTPLFHVIFENLLGLPDELRDTSRLGLLCTLPWVPAVAYRRLKQGVLIRNGQSKWVGIGTAIRSFVIVLILLIGGYTAVLPGAVLGALAISIGVIIELLFIYQVSKPVLAAFPEHDPLLTRTLTLRRVFSYYMPLATTSVLAIIAIPLGSAAMLRMPAAIESLAVWPVISGLGFLFQSTGLALTEVVVASIERRNGLQILRHFTIILGSVSSAILLLIGLTPLASFWFGVVSALPDNLLEMALKGLWLIVPYPFLSSIDGFLRGLALHSHRTRIITESMISYLLVLTILMFAIGLSLTEMAGIYVFLIARAVGLLMMVVWLALRLGKGFSQSAVA